MTGYPAPTDSFRPGGRKYPTFRGFSCIKIPRPGCAAGSGRLVLPNRSPLSGGRRRLLAGQVHPGGQPAAGPAQPVIIRLDSARPAARPAGPPFPSPRGVLVRRVTVESTETSQVISPSRRPGPATRSPSAPTSRAAATGGPGCVSPPAGPRPPTSLPRSPGCGPAPPADHHRAVLRHEAGLKPAHGKVWRRPRYAVRAGSRGGRGGAGSAKAAQPHLPGSGPPDGHCRRTITRRQS